MERLPLPVVTRQCGECQACCTTVAVEELSKGFHQRCQHQCDSGCAIYGQHPSSCQSYKCLWLDGWGPEEYRPDMVGLVVNFGMSPLHGQSRPAILVHEVWQGAAKDREKWLMDNTIEQASKNLGHPAGPPEIIAILPSSDSPKPFGAMLSFQAIVLPSVFR